MGWRAGDIIRNIKTGKPMYILHTYQTGILVADSEDSSNPTTVRVLLKRDYSAWKEESKLAMKEKKKSWYDEAKVTWETI